MNAGKGIYSWSIIQPRIDSMILGPYEMDEGMLHSMCERLPVYDLDLNSCRTHAFVALHS